MDFDKFGLFQYMVENPIPLIVYISLSVIIVKKIIC
ncbi:hypothetical protein CoNPh17_CDS0142 [Staphylococcus phage S-CoN_Ph17]|nr:hypothetical protein CoNPh17_CDS0142 [Staphylococcus phage S-CoN_Ph17]